MSCACWRKRKARRSGQLIGRITEPLVPERMICHLPGKRRQANVCLGVAARKVPGCGMARGWLGRVAKNLRHLRHDCIDVGGRTINRGKTSSRFIEDEIEVGTSQYNCFDAIASAEGVGQSSQ
jgi:hypothetical protein